MQPVTPSDAASLVILRGHADIPEVLMGKRRDTARFMPGYFVYPGGSVDPGDRALAGTDWPGTAFHAAAIRETWEETGLSIGRPGMLPNPTAEIDPCFAAMAAAGRRPAPERLHYIARAITPEESPIRFDTRFFLTDLEDAEGEARAVGELPEVVWMPVIDALSSLKLSGVTKFVLGEALSLWRERRHLVSPSRPVRVYTYADNSRVIFRQSQEDGLSA